MPIYEYECDECGHHLEALQKFSDPPIAECEECQSNKLKKLNFSQYLSPERDRLVRNRLCLQVRLNA